MKSLSMLAIVMFQSFAASAWVATPTAQKSYKYVYTVNNKELKARNQDKLILEAQAPSYEEGFVSVSKDCASHFKKAFGHSLTEDEKLDIVDACANPRS